MKIFVPGHLAEVCYGSYVHASHMPSQKLADRIVLRAYKRLGLPRPNLRREYKVRVGTKGDIQMASSYSLNLASGNL